MTFIFSLALRTSSYLLNTVRRAVLTRGYSLIGGYRDFLSLNQVTNLFYLNKVEKHFDFFSSTLLFGDFFKNLVENSSNDLKRVGRNWKKVINDSGQTFDHILKCEAISLIKAVSYPSKLELIISFASLTWTLPIRLKINRTVLNYSEIPCLVGVVNLFLGLTVDLTRRLYIPLSLSLLLSL